jgi:protoheme ferro-lyase
MTIQELYDSSIKSLPAVERLQLATLILNQIPPQSVIDYSDEWSDEDLADATRHSWKHIEAALGPEEEDA